MRSMILEGKDADRIQFLASANYSTGDAVLEGDYLFGFASADVSSGDEGVIRVKGVFDYAKPAATAIALGDKLYYDTVNDEITNVAGALKSVGTCVVAALAADDNVRILLYGEAR